MLRTSILPDHCQSSTNGVPSQPAHSVWPKQESSSNLTKNRHLPNFSTTQANNRHFDRSRFEPEPFAPLRTAQ
jgi:hypothetical protein